MSVTYLLLCHCPEPEVCTDWKEAGQCNRTERAVSSGTDYTITGVSVTKELNAFHRLILL